MSGIQRWEGSPRRFYRTLVGANWRSSAALKRYGFPDPGVAGWESITCLICKTRFQDEETLDVCNRDWISVVRTWPSDIVFYCPTCILSQ